ncbi:hypothetical protein G6F70_005256 [Rhizopus microsporus]|uniref:Uncharacterized protein n=1 Tax=Rhizopus microsporus TaxID=58291 RepID=A0A1X0S1M5_RHIZD|nr:hypothetical protein G6F71_005735 [Rhizopus microsporus]KAG1199044.1 hypothetical protein G6F70_005256 [Rhizopus microsporus]KAG1212306.1 hypothetical protein G6F69_003832 [Rhizopus microsporus]ORE18202.1 hypothetical protein BCV71DRAFT_264099 [Rhizopus microsporus]
MRSGFEWARKIELKNREAAGIQQAYSEIPTVDSVNSSELLKYLKIFGRNRKKVIAIVRRRHTLLRTDKSQTTICVILYWVKPPLVLLVPLPTE